jgi:hypothetical protein
MLGCAARSPPANQSLHRTLRAGELYRSPTTTKPRGIPVFDRLRRIFAKPKQSPTHDDAALGRLVLDPDEGEWKTTLPGDGPFDLYVGGEIEPDAACLNRAREIAADPSGFRARVTRFLGEEMGRVWTAPEAQEEIRSLRIAAVHLWRHGKRGDVGMIYFAAPSDDRVWRCDYIGSEPRDLGFDR